MRHPVINGTLFEAGRSRARPGRLVVDDNGITRFIDDANEVRVLGAFSSIAVSDRLGSVPRVLSLPDGGRFETLDNDGIDDLRNALNDHSWLSFSLAHVARIEHSIVIASIAAVILLAFAGLAYWAGIPFVAKQVAFAVPEELLEEPGDRMARYIYETITIPSQLPDVRQAELQTMFDELAQAAGSPHRYEMRVRTTDDGMVNAFALVDGTIVMLDELIKVAGNDDEIRAVMAHEIGHVEERHALRGVLQASSISLMLMAVFGDASGAIDMLLNFPVLVMLQSYSRKFEREADRYAVDLMAQIGRDPAALATMLERMTAGCGEECKEAGWLSSHPGIDERAANIRALAADKAR